MLAHLSHFAAIIHAHSNTCEALVYSAAMPEFGEPFQQHSVTLVVPQPVKDEGLVNSRLDVLYYHLFAKACNSGAGTVAVKIGGKRHTRISTLIPPLWRAA